MDTFGSFEIVNKANKPSDVSTVVKMDMELIQLQLKDMRDVYNKMVGVMNKYKVIKSDQELCMLWYKSNRMHHRYDKFFMN